MPTDPFLRLIERVLAYEGGYVDDPRDPGGRTCFGLSQRSYPNLDLGALSRERAIAIYHRDVWTPMRGDAMPAALAFQVLDAAVNHGLRRAVLWLQRALGVPEDGRVGPMTLAAIPRHDIAVLLLRYHAMRLAFYVELLGFVTYGRGWMRRLAADLHFAAEDCA